MRLPLYQVDAFTGRMFGGNPAAVVLLDEPLPEATMQDIAAENNLSETAFVLGQGSPYQLRWFTPTVEVDLCGHATLASAHVLFTEGLDGGERIQFESLRSGTLFVEREDNLLSLDFPARPATEIPCPAGCAEALRAQPSATHQTERDLLAVFDSEDRVAALKPDFERMLALDAFAIIATAPGDRSDFVSRFFGPKGGIPEDPVTGSAHCVLIPYWSRRLAKPKLHALQISKRGGELFCEDRGRRVIISGGAVTYLRGEIEV